MSFAPQNQSPDITDALDGSLTSWYDNVNNCLKSSECVPGNYEYAQSPSYSNQCPIDEGGSTRVTVKCSRFEIIDIDNSYIDAVIRFPINIPIQNTATNLPLSSGPSIYYIGYKSAFDMIDQYRVYSNGELLYTQNNSNHESFLNYISLTDSAKENSPCYATCDKVRAHNPNVPGVYVSVDNRVAITLNIEIPLKIPLNSFPMLRHLKYYPGFNGVLDIEIYPSYKNLVWINVTKGTNISLADGKDQDFEHYIESLTVNKKRLRSINGQIGDDAQDTEITMTGTNISGFTQINVQNSNLIYRTKDDVDEGDPQTFTYHIDDQIFTCSTSTLIKCHLYVAKYWIKMDVYNALEMNYLQIPLLFPIQTVTAVNFTHQMRNQSHFNLQNTATLTHCDTVYIMFPMSKDERTVSHNPEIKAQLMINGKYYPRESLSTRGDDTRFNNLTLDALNINNNPLMTVGKDISNSISPYYHKIEVDNGTNCIYDVYQTAFGDHSNFVYAVPLSTDEDFMGGISSNGSTVQIELSGSRDSRSNEINTYDWHISPIALFLEDKLLKIYSMKPPGKPQIQITNATLDQIVASGGQA